MYIHRIPFLRLISASVFVVMAAMFLTSCKESTATTDPSSPPSDDPVPVNTSIPKSPGAFLDPADNPSSAAKVELGRHLFYDKQMSVDGQTSCASCHDVASGFSDSRGLKTSMGFNSQMGTRNAPALANVAYNTVFTWDGRFPSLEKHAPGPIFNSLEMGNNFSRTFSNDTVSSGYNSKPGNNDTNFLFKRLNGDPSIRKDMNNKTYDQLRIAAWPNSQKLTMDIIAKSIAAFERTFISTQSDFDKYNNGDKQIFKYNPWAIQGFKLFTDPNGANCVSCHSGYNFTDQEFHNNGIGQSSDDKGHSAISKIPADDYTFKTPSLRNVALSGPYMHNGSFASLDQVLRNYNQGGKPGTNHDQRIKPLNLSEQDMSNIIEFLRTLTDNNFVGDKSGKFSNPWQN